MMTQRIVLNVPLPPIGPACDVHVRSDASGPAYLAVYDRDQHRWYTTADRTLFLRAAVAALDAVQVRS